MSETEWKAESTDNKASQVDIPDVLPLLPIRDIVIYPYMMLPLFVGRDVSIRAVEEALSRDRLRVRLLKSGDKLDSSKAA